MKDSEQAAPQDHAAVAEIPEAHQHHHPPAPQAFSLEEYNELLCQEISPEEIAGSLHSAAIVYAYTQQLFFGIAAEGRIEGKKN